MTIYVLIEFYEEQMVVNMIYSDGTSWRVLTSHI